MRSPRKWAFKEKKRRGVGPGHPDPEMSGRPAEEAGEEPAGQQETREWSPGARKGVSAGGRDRLHPTGPARGGQRRNHSAVGLAAWRSPVTLTKVCLAQPLGRRQDGKWKQGGQSKQGKGLTGGGHGTLGCTCVRPPLPSPGP